MKLFCGSGDKSLAKKTASYLGMSLSGVEIHVFSDGEKRIRILDSVLDEDCVIFENRFPSPDLLYMESFFLIDALKRSGARSVTLVIPYLYYQRQDHLFRNGESVSLEVIRDIFNAIGVDRLITFDLHSVKTVSIFDFKVYHLSGNSLFVDKIKSLSKGDQAFLLISPDQGGINRVKKIAGITDLPWAYIVKKRDLATGKIEAFGLKDVSQNWLRSKKTKTAVIIDDMITSGATVAKAAEVLRSNGADKIIVFVTHAVFAQEAIKNLKKANIDKIFVTDTLFLEKNDKLLNTQILSVDSIIGKCLNGLKLK